MYESYIWSNIVFLNIILLLKKISDFVCLPIFTFYLFWAILFESSPHCCLTRVQIYNFIVKCLLWLEHKKGMDIQGKYSAKTYFRYSPFFNSLSLFSVQYTESKSRELWNGLFTLFCFLKYIFVVLLMYSRG